MTGCICASGRAVPHRNCPIHGRSAAQDRLPYRGHRFWRLIVTTCHNATGAPIIDDSYTHDQEGNFYVGKTILLTPWRKNEYGEHVAQRALTIGWRRG